MGYLGKLELKQHAQLLRSKGYSYKEILEYMDVSKDTLSRWCRNISLSEQQQRRLLQNRALGQKKGSLVAAENKRKDRIARTEIIYKNSKLEVGLLNKRDRFIAGIALYAGEGEKSDHKSGFSNANPEMISFMMEWFKEFCNIPSSKFRGAIWLHEGLNEEDSKKYWSDLTRIPIDQFHKTYIAEDKKESKKVRKNIHKYGVFAIRFSSSAVQRRMIGWILAVLDGKISQVR